LAYEPILTRTLDRSGLSDDNPQFNARLEAKKRDEKKWLLGMLGSNRKLVAFEETLAFDLSTDEYLLLHQHNLLALKESKSTLDNNLLGYQTIGYFGGEIFRGFNVWSVRTAYDNVALCVEARGLVAYRLVRERTSKTIIQNVSSVLSQEAPARQQLWLAPCSLRYSSTSHEFSEGFAVKAQPSSSPLVLQTCAP